MVLPIGYFKIIYTLFDTLTYVNKNKSITIMIKLFYLGDRLCYRIIFENTINYRFLLFFLCTQQR
jgi:hypothetical protein